MIDSEHCPNCGADLVEMWLHYRFDWHEDGTVDRETPCPECGWDLTGPDPETALRYVD